MTRTPLCLLATLALGLLGTTGGAQARPDHYGPATEHAGGHGPSTARLDRVRTATSSYRLLVVAKAAGYGLLKDKDGIACIDNPGVGAMGIHYANPNLVGDGRINMLTPEAMVYEPRPNGKLRLAAVEYVVFQEAWDAAHDGPPALFGEDFMLTPADNRFGLPAFYSLHAWIWKHNPRGVLDMWNPKVRCPAA
jgi:hypothetical protein